VSVCVTSPAAGGSVRSDPVRALQHALYRAAKADPGRRFHALWDKIYRRDVLWRAWVAVFRNGGAPGIDKTTLADVQEYGVTRLLDEVATELRTAATGRCPRDGYLSPSRVTRRRCARCRFLRFVTGSCRPQ
jgi:RNA-directed DNA polymerase